MAVARTQDEIDAQLDEAASVHETGTRWPNSSYEEGVEMALLWVTGATSVPPLADE